MEKLTIGQLARRAEVHVQTMRYYERRGLMAEPPRRASGYREYGQDDVARIRFIRHAKDLGFSLKEISDLVNRIACPSCEVSVLDMKDPSAETRARSLGIRSVPAVLIDGKLAECCARRGPDEATLRAAGLGQPT